MPPVLTTRPPGSRPSPPTIAELCFCIQAYQAVCNACISSGDGWDLGAVESRKRNRYFGMMVLQTDSYTRAEASPPPCVITTNRLQPFGHRRGKKLDFLTIRFDPGGVAAISPGSRFAHPG